MDNEIVESELTLSEINAKLNYIISKLDLAEKGLHAFSDSVNGNPMLRSLMGGMFK